MLGMERELNPQEWEVIPVDQSRDGMLLIALTVEGPERSLETTFLVDTGFRGDLFLPSSQISLLGLPSHEEENQRFESIQGESGAFPLFEAVLRFPVRRLSAKCGGYRGVLGRIGSLLLEGCRLEGSFGRDEKLSLLVPSRHPQHLIRTPRW
jgi:hypothetical protein